MYNNSYNNKISERVTRNLKKQIQHQENNNSMAEPTFTTKLEIETMKDPNISGGSGYVASTLRDQGYELQNGAIGSGEPEQKIIKRKYTKRIKGGAKLGLVDLETEPRGDITIPAPLEKTAPKSTKSKLQDVVIKDKEEPQKEEPQKEEPQKETEEHQKEGGAKKKRINKYALLVKEVMRKHNIKNLAEASKYIKEHNLYSKQ